MKQDVSRACKQGEISIPPETDNMVRSDFLTTTTLQIKYIYWAKNYVKGIFVDDKDFLTLLNQSTVKCHMFYFS